MVERVRGCIAKGISKGFIQIPVPGPISGPSRVGSECMPALRCVSIRAGGMASHVTLRLYLPNLIAKENVKIIRFRMRGTLAFS
jgi:hypothetical protein